MWGRPTVGTEKRPAPGESTWDSSASAPAGAAPGRARVAFERAGPRRRRPREGAARGGGVMVRAAEASFHRGGLRGGPLVGVMSGAQRRGGLLNALPAAA